MSEPTGGSRAWSWRHAFASSSLPASTKAVLHTLGMFMNELGEGCYPSIADIVRYSGLDKKTVIKHLAIAREAGWIAVSQHGYRGQKWKRQEYVARWPERDLVAPCPPEGDEADEARPEKGGGAVPPRSDAGKVVEQLPQGGGIEGMKVVEQLHQDKTSPENFPITSPDERVRASAAVRDGKGKGKELWQTADFQKRVQRLITGEGGSGEAWPKSAGSSFEHIAKIFAGLDEEERQAAERYRDAYLAKAKAQKTQAAYLAAYLKGRQWQLLSPAEMARAVAAAERAKDGGDGTPTRPDGWAVALGPVWSACWHEHLLAGPDRPDMAPGEGEMWIPARLVVAWPKVHGLMQMASLRRGSVFAERWHELKDLVEFVALGTPEWAAWEAEYRRRGWPRMPAHDDSRGAYFPKGGPDGLGAFGERLAETRQEQVA
mgnify:CR=1 FL=1